MKQVEQLTLVVAPVSVADIERILEQYPLLHKNGLGLPREGTAEQRRLKLKIWRAALKSNEGLERIDAAHGWVTEYMQPIKTINSIRPANILLNLVKADIGEIGIGHFIVAALVAGYRISNRTHYYPKFNMSEAAIKLVYRRQKGTGHGE